METAKSIDDYIENLHKKRPLSSVILQVILYSSILGFVSYALVRGGASTATYLIVIAPLGILFWELYTRKRALGEQIWNILCPECDEYIPLHQFECPPPCGKEYTDRSILQGCPECKTRYRKGGPNAFRHAVCDNCGGELDFAAPYEFKTWSVLAKGETWETETILAKHDTFYSMTWKYMIAVGFVLLMAGYGESFPLQNDNWLARHGGIYLSFMGIVFLLIHIFLYGETRRSPNPTYKRKEEPEEIYILKYSVILFDFFAPLLFLISAAWIFDMFIKMFILPYNPYLEEPTRYTFTPFEVALRFIPLAVAIGLLIYRVTSFQEFKKVPNPRYKEEEA